MSSVQTPTSFPRRWYDASVPDLTIDLAAYHLPNTDPPSPSKPSTDRHFIDASNGTMALVDLPAPCTDPDRLISHIRTALAHNGALYAHEARNDLRRILTAALHTRSAPSNVAALAVDASSNLIRLAWTGPCGLILIRDDKVHYRSYARTAPHLALEALLNRPTALPDPVPPAQRHWPAWGGVTPYQTAFDEAAVQTEYLELEDNDLIIAGSDGFFANVSEEQILAFVRPLPDGPEDPTLAIANNTCLGSWTTDDVDFISYYLAFLASNFATANNSAPNLPFPFPPSPHPDDITVLCASCSFST